MLTAYLNATQNLLQNPQSPATLYTTANLTTYINTARGQLAGESEAVRFMGTLTTTVGLRNYNFSSISTGSGNGIQGVIHVRQLTYNIASGQQYVQGEDWPWFLQYGLNNPVPINGPPVMWSQFGQGSAGTGSITGIGAGTMGSGSIYLDPPPDMNYVLNLDCVCYPTALVLDTDVEAIPYLWTDAVPFFAAYYALLSSQTQARQADADRMFGAYQTFLQRVRNAATPAVNRAQYEQVQDPVMFNKLGLSPARQQGQQ